MRLIRRQRIFLNGEFPASFSKMGRFYPNFSIVLNIKDAPFSQGEFGASLIRGYTEVSSFF